MHSDDLFDSYASVFLKHPAKNQAIADLIEIHFDLKCSNEWRHPLFCTMKFWKYQGAGNDFVLLDQREQQWITRTDTPLVAQLCDRRFGIGADGLILLQNHPEYDFEMVYFNSDGRESTMCGNGGRCIAAFAQHLGVTAGHCSFMAIDGVHEANITPKNLEESWVELKMIPVENVEKLPDAYVLNTGSPHYVRFVEALENLDMVAEGRAIRYGERWKKEGINVNFAAANAKPEYQNNSREKGLAPNAHLAIRTYERGVEDETYACGTGVTAVAIASSLEAGAPAGDIEVAVQAKGGNLAVRFHANGDGTFSNIWLCGPAVCVFEGVIKNIERTIF
jgi:diaminopimelate epimerase